MSEPPNAGRLSAGETLPVQAFETIAGKRITAPEGGQLLHVQMRRFAGCPVCNVHLRSFVQRIERLEADKTEVMADIKEVYAEAKGQGFDVKTMRKVVRIRKMDTDQRREEEAILETYLAALGIV